VFDLPREGGFDGGHGDRERGRPRALQKQVYKKNEWPLGKRKNMNGNIFNESFSRPLGKKLGHASCPNPFGGALKKREIDES